MQMTFSRVPLENIEWSDTQNKRTKRNMDIVVIEFDSSSREKKCVNSIRRSHQMIIDGKIMCLNHLRVEAL